MGAKSRFWQTETGKKLLASGMFMAVFLILAIPIHALNINSSVYCKDNYTQTYLYWVDEENVTWDRICTSGTCDNVSSACAPMPYESSVYTMGIIIAIIIGIAMLYRWSKR